MPKLRADDYDIDWDKLEETPVESSFEPYNGPQPPQGTILSGYHRKMWWTLTQPKPGGGGEDPMIVDLWIAEANEGDEEKYNGLPVFSRWALVPGAKFRWAPAFEIMGFTLKDIRDGKCIIGTEDDEDNVGIPIKKIGKFVPGEDNDAAWCRIVTEDHEYGGSTTARAGTWLPWEDTEDTLPTDEEDEAADAGIDPDLEEDLEEETEPEPAPARAGRGTRSAASPQASRTPSKTPAARTATATAGRGSARPSATGRAARTATATPARPTRGRRTAAADVADDEPPF